MDNRRRPPRAPKTVASAVPATRTGVAADGRATPTLAIVAVDLHRWDASPRGDLLGVYIWTDVRPLRGAAGLLDWRLCGKVSSLIQSGRLTGAEGEQLLLPTAGRLPWNVAMVMGLGSRAGFSASRYRAALGRTLAAARGLGVHDIALAPPGRDINALPSRQAIDLLVDEIRGASHGAWVKRLTVIEPATGHKDLADLFPPAPKGGARSAR